MNSIYLLDHSFPPSYDPDYINNNINNSFHSILNVLSSNYHNIKNKFNIILNNLLHLTKSQGGYISFVNFDHYDNIENLFCIAINIVKDYGNINDIILKDHLTNGQ
jgi:hypothetical protein